MTPKISICVPWHFMKNWQFFLTRCLESIEKQTFKDYEVVLTNNGSMAHNHNSAILGGKGELVKLLQMDDYLAHPDALKDIVDNFETSDNWMITACDHILEEKTGVSPHYPSWSDNMLLGDNTLGGGSTIVLRNDKPLLFDESLCWMLDCDLYYRYYQKFGLPRLLNTINVTVDLRGDRLTHTLDNEQKVKEVEYLKEKHG